MVVSEAISAGLQKIDGEPRERVKLRKACEEFEAFLISYILRQMWQAAEAVSDEKPFMTYAYRDLFSFELAQSLVPSMKLGIAETLYNELSMPAGSEKSLRG